MMKSCCWIAILVHAHLNFFPLFVKCSFVDPDTEKEHRNRLIENKNWELVFSDEFNAEGRKFYDGYDSRWTAIDKNDNTNKALHYFNASLVETVGGALAITAIQENVTFQFYDNEKDEYRQQTKSFQVGIIQGWNKFCFTGGILEISAKLPGKHNVSGHWPAMWLLGNLARHSYIKSSENIWPWSFSKCDRDISPQSQLISACNIPNKELGLNPYQGRGAPEIDILEGMPGNERLPYSPISRPYFSTSLQISPSIKSYTPTRDNAVDSNHWYNHGIQYGINSSINVYFYGLEVTPKKQKILSYRTNALSANANLNKQHFESFHKYRLEWETGSNGYLRWYLDDRFIYGIEANALNITGALIPEEPMYLILQMGIDKSWGFPRTCPKGCSCDCFDCNREECRCALPEGFCDNLPGVFLIDYVRIYQDKSNKNHTIGCSPPSHPTEKYIQYYQNRYKERDSDTIVMSPVRIGGGECIALSGKESCGRGTCVDGLCTCDAGYGGPTCLSALNYTFSNLNQIQSDSYLNLADKIFLSKSVLLTLIFLVIFTIVFFVLLIRRKPMPYLSSSSIVYTSMDLHSFEIVKHHTNKEDFRLKNMDTKELYYQVS